MAHFMPVTPSAPATTAAAPATALSLGLGQFPDLGLPVRLCSDAGLCGRQVAVVPTGAWCGEQSSFLPSFSEHCAACRPGCRGCPSWREASGHPPGGPVA